MSKASSMAARALKLIGDNIFQAAAGNVNSRLASLVSYPFLVNTFVVRTLRLHR